MRNNTSDPIFAVIQAHKAAYAAFDVVVGELAPIEKAFWAQGLTASSQKDHPIMVAYNKKWNAADNSVRRAEMKLCRTKPTTLAGISALALYLVDAWDPSVPGTHAWDVQAPDGDYLECLLRTIASAAGRIGAKQSAKVLPFRAALRKAA